METLKYKIIKRKGQYNQYCKTLEELIDGGSKSKVVQDEIDLVTLLIEKYDAEHNTFAEVEPVALLKSFMADHNMKSKDLVNLLGMNYPIEVNTEINENEFKVTYTGVGDLNICLTALGPATRSIDFGNLSNGDYLTKYKL